MKKTMMALGFVMVLIFSLTYVYALDQGGDPGQKGMGEMGHSHKGWGHDKGLSFTPEQQAKFKELRRDFRRDNAQLIGSLVAKKIELQALLTDPKADSNAIMDKSRELRDVQNQLRDKFVGTMLEARKMLTPEQIDNLKPAWFWRHGHGHGHMMESGGMMEHREMMGHGGMMGHERMMEHGYGRCRCE